MGTAKWWVCDSCKSLNDLPANKCYKCRVPKPDDPTLIDDEYGHVGGGKRVGITVDLSKVGELTRPDPLETAEGGNIMEAFDSDADIYADIDTVPPTPRYDPYTGGPESAAAPRPGPRPLREPVRRGIDAIGGRHWTEEPATTAPAGEPSDAVDPAPGASAPPPAPPPGVVPPPGVAPYPGPAQPPPGPPPSGVAPRPPMPPPPGPVRPGTLPPPPMAGPRPPVPPPPGPPRPPGVPLPPGVPPPLPPVGGRPPVPPSPPGAPPPAPAPPPEVPGDE